MCGIAGWCDWERPLDGERAVLEAMSQPLACRGPDAEGMWVARHCGFAHRRLVVVDPEGGQQPMVRQVGKDPVVLIYNGELYNTEELRQELSACGHRFEGHSDTEVLLVSYLQWGVQALERLNGIFAFAIWDARHQSLFLARDRLGVKPLFYAPRGRGLVFGSELKALLAHPAVEPVLEADGLAEVLGLGPARTPGHGIFRGVYELRPGFALWADRRGVRLQRYWKLESRPHPHSPEQTRRHLQDLLVDTVRRQLVADVPVVTLLSGGLDSSLVTALAHQAFLESGRGPLHTFSVEFVDQARHFRPTEFVTSLDAPWVARVSKTLGTIHHTVVLDTPALDTELLPSLWARDLPGMADIDTSLMVFCREIKREATVALSGEAADEVFGGYPWFRLPEAIWSDTFPWSRTVSERLRVWSPEAVHMTRLETYIAARYREALEEVPHLAGEEGEARRLREIAYLSLTRFLACLLDRKDRMSMASGLEVRVPYCDHRLVEYVWNIPWDLKRYRGEVKGILRWAAEAWLPPEVAWRRKSPYPSTLNPSYREAMRRRLIREVLEDPTAPARPFIRLDFVRALTDPRQEIANIPWYGQLMGTAQLFAYLIQFNAWLRDYRIRIA
ncbi:MAG: asparagine synthase (glutamine-hydrolyzing) [Firmicutes bacterium]|nr:asparagine synthase (glutamine-hydrolyzing) [Alicyclobacillaceae bacterium]MCL6496529.1 asparagine synthase (glutamine-hydrolyzing) [Bacillota bacterium]